jgi:hypothetical protein
VPLAGSIRFGIHRPDNLSAVSPIAGTMRATRIPVTPKGRTLRIVAFVSGVTDLDHLAADVAGWKVSVAAPAIVEGLSGCGGSRRRGGS